MVEELREQAEILRELRAELNRVGDRYEEASVAKIINPSREYQMAFVRASEALREVIARCEAYRGRLIILVLH